MEIYCMCVFAGCGGTYRAPWGEITSPNYPYNYDIGLDCVYVIRLDYVFRMYLNIEDFALEYSDGCNRDYLNVCLKQHYGYQKVLLKKC